MSTKALAVVYLLTKLFFLAALLARLEGRRIVPKAGAGHRI